MKHLFTFFIVVLLLGLMENVQAQRFDKVNIRDTCIYITNQVRWEKRFIIEGTTLNADTNRKVIVRYGTPRMSMGQPFIVLNLDSAHVINNSFYILTKTSIILKKSKIPTATIYSCEGDVAVGICLIILNFAVLFTYTL